MTFKDIMFIVSNCNRGSLMSWPHACFCNLSSDVFNSFLYKYLFCFFPFPPDLIHCTNELNVSIPHLADTLLERTASNSWIVVFKALITTHHLMMYGNEVSGARPREPREGKDDYFTNSQDERSLSS